MDFKINSQWTIFSNNGLETNGRRHANKSTSIFFFLIYTKITWLINTNIKANTVKPLEEILYDLKSGNIHSFLTWDTKKAWKGK